MDHKPTANKKMQLALLMICCLLVLSGCWNSRELDELGIAVSLGLDKNEEGDYLLSVQVINPSEIATEAPTTRPPVSTYTTTGETLFEAFRRLTTKSPRKIYFSQLRLVVVGTKLAEEGIMPALDFFYRDHEFRPSFYVMVAKNASVEDMLSVITPFEKIPANKIMNSIDNVMNNWGASQGVSLDKLISAIRSPGEEPALGGIILEGSADIGTNMSNVENVDAPTKLEIDHIAVFKSDKLAGWLTEEESQGLNFVKGNVNSTILTSPCEDEGTLSVEILRSQPIMVAKMKGDKPSITIDIHAEGNIGEVDCKVDLGKPNAIKKINKEAEKNIKEKVQSAITVAQEEYASDMFGFGNVVERDEPKYWKKAKNDWESQFKDLDITVKVKVAVRRKGNSTQPIDKKG